MAFRAAESIQRYLLEKLRHERESLKQPYDLPNPAIDTLSIVGAQLHFLQDRHVRHRILREDLAKFASQLCTWSARGLFLAFSFIPSYAGESPSK